MEGRPVYNVPQILIRQSKPSCVQLGSLCTMNIITRASAMKEKNAGLYKEDHSLELYRKNIILMLL